MTDRIDHIEHHLSSIDQRVQALEKWKGEANLDLAVRGERDKHLDRRFDKIEEQLKELKGYFTKVALAVILGILGYFLTFMVNGGLVVTP